MSFLLQLLKRRQFSLALRETRLSSEKEIRDLLAASSELDWIIPVEQFKSTARTIIKKIPQNLTNKEKNQVLKILVHHFSERDQTQYIKKFKICLKRESFSFYNWIASEAVFHEFNRDMSPLIYENLFHHAAKLKKVAIDSLNRINKRNRIFDELIKQNLPLPVICNISAMSFLYPKYFSYIVKNQDQVLFDDIVLDKPNFEYATLKGREKKIADANIKTTFEEIKDPLNEFFKSFPVSEIVLIPFSGKSIIDYKELSSNSNIYFPKSYDFLHNYLGVKSAIAMDLFLKSNSKNMFVTVAKICKELFVKNKKLDYSYKLLAKDVSSVNFKYRHTLVTLADHYLSTFNYHFSPE